MPEAPNPRHFPREPQPGALTAALVNPADKYQSKADNLHKYGSWLMGCLPKYIQQFSVWKDELTIYISPPGVIPVFSFLKCKIYQFLSKLFRCKELSGGRPVVWWWWVASLSNGDSD